MLRVAIDGSLAGYSYGGVGQYVLHLVEGLAATPGCQVTVYVPGYAVERCDVTQLPAPSRVVTAPVEAREGSFYDTRAHWEQDVLPAELDRDRPDVFFGPIFMAPLAWDGSKVVTVHDLAFEHEGHNTSGSTVYYQRWARQCAEDADSIIGISHATAADVEARWQLGRKVTVTHLAPCLSFVPADPGESKRQVRDAYDLDGPFALNVGGTFPRKNLPRLLEAVSRTRSFRHNHTLAVVAKAKPEVLEEVDRWEVAGNVRVLGYCAPDILPHLYSAADFFVYPSLLEGFGLPPLEAMQCATAVAVSGREPFGEVLGDNAVFFDPTDPADIAASLDRLSTDEQLRRRLAQRGRAHAARFSWNATVAATKAVLEAAA